MKILVCATHPGQCNGYSLCAYNLVKELAIQNPKDSIAWYGFQNVFGDNSRNDRPLPDNVEVWDAMKHEEPRKQGFGEDHVVSYIAEKDPDIVFIYNDSVVVERFLQKIKEIEAGERRFKIVVYQDLVYEHMKKRFVKQLNDDVDRVLAFTPYWKEHMRAQGVTTPISVLRHGFDPDSKFPVPSKLARRVYGIGQDDFVVLNLNRNQPRKRWDICIKAFAEFLSRHRGEAVRLLIGTSHQGSWDLLELFERELQKRGISIEEGRKHITVNNMPQQMSDAEINILMNCADIGITAADGEGFGLCNFEHAAIGKPQVVSWVGGAKDVFDGSNACVCEPVIAYYVDSSRDGVGGEAQIIDYADMVQGIERYYSDPELRKKHGDACRKKILGADYSWPELAKTLRSECAKCMPEPEPVEPVEPIEPEPIEPTVPDEIDFIAEVRDIASVHAKIDRIDGRIDEELKTIKDQLALIVAGLGQKSVRLPTPHA